MDPLAQLKDIHLPEQINHYPLAYGWWLLALMIVVTLALVTRAWLNSRKLNKAKKQALSHLSNDKLELNDIISIIKWGSLQYFPRQQIAALYGDELVNFLIKQLPEKSQQASFIDVLKQAINQQYQATESAELELSEVKAAASQWLNLALPPKTKKHGQNTAEPQEATQ